MGERFLFYFQQVYLYVFDVFVSFLHNKIPLLLFCLQNPSLLCLACSVSKWYAK